MASLIVVEDATHRRHHFSLDLDVPISQILHPLANSLSVPASDLLIFHNATQVDPTQTFRDIALTSPYFLTVSCPIDRVPPDLPAQLAFLQTSGFPEATARRALELSSGHLRLALQFAHFGCPSPIPDPEPLPPPAAAAPASTTSELLMRLRAALDAWLSGSPPQFRILSSSDFDPGDVYLRRQQSEILLRILEALQPAARFTPDFSRRLDEHLSEFRIALSAYGEWDMERFDLEMGNLVTRFYGDFDSRGFLFDLHGRVAQFAKAMVTDLAEDAQANGIEAIVEDCTAALDLLSEADGGAGFWIAEVPDVDFGGFWEPPEEFYDDFGHMPRPSRTYS
jgi:hypothetical protein